MKYLMWVVFGIELVCFAWAFIELGNQDHFDKNTMTEFQKEAHDWAVGLLVTSLASSLAVGGYYGCRPRKYKQASLEMREDSCCMLLIVAFGMLGFFVAPVALGVVWFGLVATPAYAGTEASERVLTAIAIACASKFFSALLGHYWAFQRTRDLKEAQLGSYRMAPTCKLTSDTQPASP
jgi:hypothetical protein